MCSIFDVPPPLSFLVLCVCVCIVAVALCCVSIRPRRSWKHSSIFCSFLPTCFIFFTIQYDNLLQCCCGSWEKTHNVIFTNTVSAELATISTHTHTHTYTVLLTSVCVLAIWIELSGPSLPAYPPSSWIELIAERYKRNVCYHCDMQVNRSRCTIADPKQTAHLCQWRWDWEGCIMNEEMKSAASEAKWVRSEFSC